MAAQTNKDKTNVIFIGSFSPVHDGHVHLIEEYAKNGNNVDVIISNSPREGISPKSSYDFLTKIFKNPKLNKKGLDNPNITIEISNDNSPMLSAINKVKNAKSGTFALASSTKEGDETRSLDFKKKFEKGKSLYNPNVNVIKLNANAEPLYYHNRKDQYNDKPISSTIVRKDIRNNNFDNFLKAYEQILKNYQGITGNDIKEYYDVIKNELLPIKESSLYDDLNEIQKFKKPTNIVKDNLYYKDLYEIIDLTYNKALNDGSPLDGKVIDVINEYKFDSFSLNELYKIFDRDKANLIDKLFIYYKGKLNPYKREFIYLDANYNFILFPYTYDNKWIYIILDAKTLEPLNFDFNKKIINESIEFKKPTNIVKDNNIYSKLYDLFDYTRNAFIPYDDYKLNNLNNLISDILNFYEFKTIDHLNSYYNKEYRIGRNLKEKLIHLYNEYYDLIKLKYPNAGSNLIKKGLLRENSYILIEQKYNNRQVLLFEYPLVITKENRDYHTWLHIFFDINTLKPIDGFDINKLYIMETSPILNESINQSFIKPTNIVDDNIGVRHMIRNWMSKYTNAKQHEYTINDDNTIDVNLKSNRTFYFVDGKNFLNDITELPSYIVFRTVNNNMNVSYSLLQTLKGFPETVNGFFNCSNCRLITLKYGPKYVSKRYDCDNNYLSSFEGAPLKCSYFKGNIQHSIGDIYTREHDELNDENYKKYIIQQYINESINFERPNNIVKNNIDYIQIIERLKPYLDKNIYYKNKNITSGDIGEVLKIINTYFQFNEFKYPKYDYNFKNKKTMFSDIVDKIEFPGLGCTVRNIEIINSKAYKNKVQLILFYGEHFHTKDEFIRIHLIDKLNEQLNEGGAAKHMSHPYEINEFTFKDIEKLINDLLNGNINNATEKMDGLNLFVSYDKDGNIIAARNNRHLNGDYLTLNNIADNFKSKHIGEVYYNALKNIDKEVKQKYGIQSLKHLFKNGNRWLNTEIITNETENIIPYNEPIIVFHDFRTYDNDKLIKIDKNKLNEFVKSLSNKSDFNIMTSPQVRINKSSDLKFKENIINELNNIKSKYNLNNNSTIEDYKKNILLDIILKDEILSKLDDKVIKDLIERWLYGPNKNNNINNILKDISVSDKDYIKSIDKNINKIIQDKMKPFDIIFIKVGNEVINNLSGISNNQNKNNVIQQLNKRLSDVAEAISNSDDEIKKDKLYKELDRLTSVSNKLNPTEGIVFNWKDKLLKITGSFAPLNQILGLAPGRFDN